MSIENFILLLYILALASYTGYVLISKVPPTLHTPLMSGVNAISGITIVGSILSSNIEGFGSYSKLFGLLAIIFATINVIGGYSITDKMLKMFKKKP